MNNVTSAFNELMMRAIKDTELIENAYERATARTNIMKTLAMTNGVEVNLVGVAKSQVTQTPRETLDNAPNLSNNETSNSASVQQRPDIIPGSEPGINTNGASCGSEDLPVRPVMPTPPAADTNPTPATPAPEANTATVAQPAAAVQQNPQPAEERPFIDPVALGDEWNPKVFNMLMSEIQETKALVQLNPNLVTPTLMSEVGIAITNGAVTTVTTPMHIPPKMYRIFLSALKKRVVDAGGKIPA